jgi:hypothetical protein
MAAAALESHIPEHIAEPVPEEADFLLRSELSPEQGVFFGDLITLKAPFSANTYHWKKDGKVLNCNLPDLTIKSFTSDDIGEYSVEDDLHQSSATIVLGLLMRLDVYVCVTLWQCATRPRSSTACTAASATTRTPRSATRAVRSCPARRSRSSASTRVCR